MGADPRIIPPTPGHIVPGPRTVGTRTALTSYNRTRYSIPMSRKELTLENLKTDGACSPGLEWITPILNSGRVPTKTAWKLRPNYYLWALGKGYNVPLEILDYCARESPWLALAYAAAHLTPETLDYCARLLPAAALACAAAHLTPKTRAWCEAKAG